MSKEINKTLDHQNAYNFLLQDENIIWYIFFEKMLPNEADGDRYNELRGYLRLDNNTLKGEFKSHPKQNDFKININLQIIEKVLCIQNIK